MSNDCFSIAEARDLYLNHIKNLRMKDHFAFLYRTQVPQNELLAAIAKYRRTHLPEDRIVEDHELEYFESMNPTDEFWEWYVSTNDWARQTYLTKVLIGNNAADLRRFVTEGLARLTADRELTTAGDTIANI